MSSPNKITNNKFIERLYATLYANVGISLIDQLMKVLLERCRTILAPYIIYLDRGGVGMGKVSISDT